MVEPEIAFADLDDLADLAEDFLKYIFAAVLEECPDDMAFFAQRIEATAISRLEAVIETPFVRLDYAEAIEILKDSGVEFEYPGEWGLDLQTEHERYLTEEHFKAPGGGDELSDRDQGVLHAAERRRPNRGRPGRAGARHR